MTPTLAVALLALLVALFALVALVAVYARVRALEAGRAAELSGYAPLVGRPAPAAVHPRAGQRAALVAVLDADCALCHDVRDALAAGEPDPALRLVALADRTAGFRADPGGVHGADPGGVHGGDPDSDHGADHGGHLELLADADVRAGLFEGYSPTLVVVDPTGVVTDRRFVHADTDLRALLLDLTRQRHPDGREVTRA